MSVIIHNISDHDGAEQPSDYVVQINNGPALARFKHIRSDGLAECLRKAALAVELADLPNPFARK